jgi:S-adenosylmethionine synthetase
MRAEKSHSPTSVYADDTNIIVKSGYNKYLRRNMENLDVNKDIEVSLISALPRSILSIP